MRSLLSFALAAAIASSSAHASAADATSDVLRAPAPTNLKLSLACADDPFVTSEAGLQVAIDGRRLDAGATEYGWSSVASRHGYEVPITVPVDVGFSVSPGPHTLDLDAPGCLRMRRDIEVPGSSPLALGGSLETSPSLRGPVDAPDGPALALSGTYSTFPTSLTSGPTSNAITPATFHLTGSAIGGGDISMGLARRHFVAWLDLGGGGGSYSGRISPHDVPGLTPASGPLTMDGSVFTGRLGLRVGARLPLRYVALSAGTGIGGSLWITGSPTIHGNPDTNTSQIEGAHGIWSVPIWAALEVKVACNWGVELRASYDIQPTDTSGDTFLLSGGILLEPAGACSRTVHLDAIAPS